MSRRRRHRLARCTLLSVALLGSLQARSIHGFTGWEHCSLGNEGFRLALAYAEEDPELKEALRDSLPMLRNFQQRACVEYKSEKPRVRSYGEAVKVVDYIQRPHRLFKNLQPGDFKQADVVPTRWDDLQVEPDSVAPQPDQLPTQLGFHNGLSPSIPRQVGLESLRATAGNTHHFQGELFVEMRSLHEDALRAALDGDLFYALVLNAISDHFLHDFFAPGHLATQRDNSHDAVALGLHDRINHNQADRVCLLANKAGWDEDLKGLLEFLRERCVRGDCPNWIKKQKWSKKLAADKLKTEEAQSRWHSSPEESLLVIDGLECKILRDEPGGCEAVSEPPGISTICRDIDKEPTVGLPMRGDGQLPEQPAQQLFMLLAQMRSVLDVLEAYAHRRVSDSTDCFNSFDTHKWTGFPDADAAAVACISYGCYTIQERDRWKASDLLMLGIGGHAPQAGTGGSRLELALELVPLSVIASQDWLREKLVMTPDCGLWSLCNSTVVLGASYKGDDSYSALGPRLRYLKVLPKIDIQLSAQAEYLRYRPDFGDPLWDWSYGVRGDLGFSVMSLYVGFGRGVYANAGALDRGYELSFGVGVGVAVQRLRKLFRRPETPWLRDGSQPGQGTEPAPTVTNPD